MAGMLPDDRLPAPMVTLKRLVNSIRTGVSLNGAAGWMALPRVQRRRPRIRKRNMQSPIEIKIGQQWSAWVPSRGQWLLTTVVRRKDGQAVLQFDGRYGIARGYDEQKADEITMAENTSLFRFIGLK